MSKGIRLSKKHGVNPRVGVCQWCGEDDGNLALRLPGDVAAPHKAIVSREPCKRCKEQQARGITLFCLGTNGYVRAWLVLLEQALDRLVSDEKMREELRAKRYGQVDEAVLVALRGEDRGEG